MLEKMMDDIVRKYGFESSATIKFCEVCEDVEETMLYIIWLYALLMNLQKEVVFMAKKRNYKAEVAEPSPFVHNDEIYFQRFSQK